MVILDPGMARSISTTTLTSDVYAFVFDQKGLMAGVGIQGFEDHPDPPGLRVSWAGPDRAGCEQKCPAQATAR